MSGHRRGQISPSAEGVAFKRGSFGSGYRRTVINVERSDYVIADFEHDLIRGHGKGSRKLHIAVDSQLALRIGAAVAPAYEMIALGGDGCQINHRTLGIEAVLKRYRTVLACLDRHIEVTHHDIRVGRKSHSLVGLELEGSSVLAFEDHGLARRAVTHPELDFISLGSVAPDTHVQAAPVVGQIQFFR